MLSACNMSMAVRLALTRRPRAGRAAREAMLFELPRAGSAGYSAPFRSSSDAAAAAAPPVGGSGRLSLAARSAMVLPGDGVAEVAASRLQLHNTLLASALRHKQARFVRDCGAYMQVRRGAGGKGGGGKSDAEG
jgi:hypothetical protein